MKNFLEIIKTVVMILPSLVSLIEIIEGLFPESGKGAEKLSLLKNIIQIIYEATKAIEVPFNELWTVLQRVVDAIVAVFNKTGKFSSPSSLMAAMQPSQNTMLHYPPGVRDL